MTAPHQPPQTTVARAAQPRAARCRLAVAVTFAAVATVLVSAVTLATAPGASAEVRLGDNVRIGGHDFSNQTYNARRRGRIHLYDRAPPRQGCVWRADGRGGKVKVCHLRRRN